MSFVRARPKIPSLVLSRMIVSFSGAVASIAGVVVRCEGGSGPRRWNPLGWWKGPGFSQSVDARTS